MVLTVRSLGRTGVNVGRMGMEWASTSATLSLLHPVFR